MESSPVTEKRPVLIQDLQVGRKIPFDLMSGKNSILLRKGSVIRAGFLDMLCKHRFGDLHFLAIESDEPPPGVTASEKIVEPEKKFNVERAKEILRRGVHRKLDEVLDHGVQNILPSGPSLDDSLEQKMPADRSLPYKMEVQDSYFELVAQAKKLYEGLLDESFMTVDPALKIVNRLMKTFLSDRLILVNLSLFRANAGDYLYAHAIKVCIVSMNLASAMGFSRSQVEEVGLGALLSDIGMLMVRSDVRLGRESLSNEERQRMKLHPLFSLNLLQKIQGMPRNVPIMAYQSHERENGSGYPKGRLKQSIHPFARIVMVADIYAAMVSNRAHRNSERPYKAVEHLLAMVKQNMLDGKVVRCFLAYIGLFPVGSLVRLSDGSIGKVVATNRKEYHLPTLSILTNEKGTLLPSRNIVQVDLSMESDLQIDESIDEDTLPISRMQGF